MEGKRFLISALLDTYGPLLSDRQRDVLDLYYNGDLSLAEIGDDTGITRQGVRDALKKGEAELLTFEEKLGFMKKSERLQAMAEEVQRIARQLDNKELYELAARFTAEF